VQLKTADVHQVNNHGSLTMQHDVIRIAETELYDGMSWKAPESLAAAGTVGNATGSGGGILLLLVLHGRADGEGLAPALQFSYS